MPQEKQSKKPQATKASTAKKQDTKKAPQTTSKKK